MFKPTKRLQLLADGYVVVGLIGDQWSDLNGPNGTPAAFKTPNPFYFIQ